MIHVFFCEFFEIFKNTYFMKHFQMTTYVCCHYNTNLENMIYYSFIWFNYGKYKTTRSAFYLFTNSVKFVIIFIIHYPSPQVASRVITILWFAQTVSVTLMHPISLFCTKHLLQFKCKPSNRSGWILSVCKPLYGKKYICIVSILHGFDSCKFIFSSMELSSQYKMVAKKRGSC